MNSFEYSYDLANNITSRNENNYATNFTYTPLNQLKTSSEFDETYTYDSRYNRATVASTRELPVQEAQYEYDKKNQLTRVSGTHNPITYSYTGEGLLYERTENGVTNRYYYDENQLLLAEATVSSHGESQMNYMYIHDLNGQLIGRHDVAAGKMKYYQLNGHGDVVAVVDELGNKLNEYRYDVWGLPLEERETVPNILKYSGEYWDKTTKLQYLRARWYDPSMGRFINEDTYEGEIREPLTLNLYTYVANNPLVYIDPTGNTYHKNGQSLGGIGQPGMPVMPGGIPAAVSGKPAPQKPAQAPAKAPKPPKTQAQKQAEANAKAHNDGGALSDENLTAKQSNAKGKSLVIGNKSVVDAMLSNEKKYKSILAYDCSEIAEDLALAAGNKGKIITIKSSEKNGTINVTEYGKTEIFEYHTVYSDGTYVYDPRFSNQPIPVVEYMVTINKQNDGNVSVSTEILR
ncbi:RHS repeat-associated core domain-containing protein [Paenibacillus sp. GSMTC-2017]|nr:RHS repeat-associated core domain-containing protein [Paenibacillus sp. GSMTC-2017]